ncbi:MAG TPA: DUF6029 family protein [Polyangium sp.]|nr:DUF6029 family protein [Polyangium sp.]
MKFSSRLGTSIFVVASSVVVAPNHARALDLPGPKGEPIGLDVTNTSVVDYRWNNRNNNLNSFNPRPIVDDDYGEWINRFNAQATWWRFRVGVRVDSAVYFLTTTRNEGLRLAADQIAAVKARNPDAIVPEQVDYANRFYRELNTRFLNTVYPAKLFVGYNQPGVDVTVGDFYAQLGRGMVLSIRKIDELAIDTTIRGAKVVLDRRFGKMRFGATLLGGQMNPLRFDEVSGRRLHGRGSPLFFGFPKAQSVTTYTPSAKPITEPGIPSYLEDTIFGGRFEGGTNTVQIAANGSILVRESFTEQNAQCISQCAPSDKACVDQCLVTYPEFVSPGAGRGHGQIRTFSGSINIPSIAGIADFYLEGAGQQLRQGHPTVDDAGNVLGRVEDVTGYAVYGSANFGKGPVQVSLEGKHYRRFFALGANIDVTTPGHNAPEYSVVAYSAPPTSEPIYVEPIESPNVCMTGGRGKIDYKYNPTTAAYAWVGRYRSFTEIPGNDLCASTSDAYRTDTWDSAVGIDFSREKGKSHAKAWLGMRLAERAVPSGGTTAPGETDVLYYEGYIRYDLVKHLKGPFSLQMTGFHRNRYLPGSHPRPWNEGENYTALHWSPHLSAIMGYEYSTRPGCDPGQVTTDPTEFILCHYVSGGLTYRAGSTAKLRDQILNTVNVFVGQRRGAIRCVSGVCRLFPPFEGARIELVSRF